MKLTRTLLLSLPAIAICFASTASAADLTAEFDAKHKNCLERIAVDNDLAYEEAMIWQDEGGGRRAKHCVAMALYALGHEDEAASRLDALAIASDGGTKLMRADFYAEAANFWLVAGEADRAYKSASDGLKLRKDHVDLRIARARAYAILGRYDYAETDLTSVLVFTPDNADALRYRADAKMKQGRLAEAKIDIERALRADPTEVETALLRGQINEAIRLDALPKTSAETP
ncbi:tetratricopeptide repeat protein [Hellea sp.]|nr:tetratricopeptide repeat protein [Hellea sp.]